MSKPDATVHLFEDSQPQPTDEHPELAVSLSKSKVISAIDRFIKDPPENSRVYTITPAIAQYIIDTYNFDNRPVRPSKIALYAVDISNDNWGLTGDTLKFSDASKLRDGQNQLYGCLKAGKPFRTHVVFGIDDALFALMDRGKNRDGGDLLAIKGVINAPVVSAAVRWAEMLDTGTVKQRPTFQASEILDLYERKFSGLTGFVTDAKKTGQPAGMMTALIYHFAKVDPTHAVDFGAAWAGGQRQGRNIPIKKAEARILEIFNASSGRVHDVVRAAIIINAWNLYRINRKGSSKDFNWDLSKPFPKIQ